MDVAGKEVQCPMDSHTPFIEQTIEIFIGILLVVADSFREIRKSKCK